MLYNLGRSLIFRPIVIILIFSLSILLFTNTINSQTLNREKNRQEKTVTGAPVLLVPFLAAAGVGAAFQGTKYLVTGIFWGNWNIADQIGHIVSGALWGMAGLAVLLFAPQVLSDIFGAADQAGIADVLGDILGDFFEGCAQFISSMADVTFNNIKDSIVSNQTEFTSRFLPTLEALCNSAGYVPDAPCFNPIWADFKDEVIQYSNIMVEPIAMEYNSYYGTSWRMLNPGTSRLICTFNLTDVPRGAILSLTHLSSGDPGAPGGGYSPVDIYVNSYLFKDNFDVAENHSGSHSYETDQWEVSDYLVAGTNTIRIELEDDPWAYTHYWIQTIALVPGGVSNEDLTSPEIIEKYYSNSRNTNIYVTFNEDMNASTFTNNTVTVNGSSSGTHSCSFGFDHSSYELTINPYYDFSYGENVSVTIGTGVQDLAGNGLANPYSFNFNIESSPPPDPTSINISASLSPSNDVPAYSIVQVNGSVTYNTGSSVPVGNVDINTGENVYTAAISNGTFNRNIYAPSSSRNISITATDDQYHLSRIIQKWIDIQSTGPTVNYDLDTYVVYDYYYDGNNVSWSDKDAFRTTDEYVNAFAFFTNVNTSHDLRIMWRFYKPDGTQYGSDLVSSHYVPAGQWDWYYITWGYLIRDQLMSYLPGLYRIDTYIDEGSGFQKKRTDYYSIAWVFTEHRLCKDVQGSDPYMPINETDVFYQTDTKAVTWANFNLVAQGGELKCLFYEPSSALYAEESTANSPDYRLSDPGGAHTWYEWYRAWAWIWINGYNAANKCGDWRAEFYVKNPTSGNWENYYDENFKILENPAQNPSTSVTINPPSPIETQNIDLNISANDNTYLKKVILYWNNGSTQNVTWDNIYSTNLSQSKNIGSYAANQQIEYWAKSWDTSNNQYESEHRTIIVLPEIVTVPNRPSGEACLQVSEAAVYSTGGSSTNLGHSVEYQFDWGNGQQSFWGSSSQSYSWSSDGIYFVKARSRCQTHTNRMSDWSNALMVTVESLNPIVAITTNNGNDFTTDQTQITIDGTATDPDPSSGLASLTINSGDSNNGTFSNWSFDVDIDEGPNTFTITATDIAGNSANASIVITRNTTSNTLYVDDDNINGPWDGTETYPFRLIQDAINVSDNCDTIKVKTGIYNELLSVPHSLALIGEDKENTIIDALFQGNCINPPLGQENWFYMTGFTVQNSSNTWTWPVNAISLNYNTIGIIENNIFKGHATLGVCSHGNDTLRNNIIFNNGYGVFITSESKSEVYNNIIISNSAGIIIHNQAIRTRIFNNIIYNNSTGFNNGGCEDVLVEYNNVWGNNQNIVGEVDIGEGNIYINPLLVSIEEHDYRLIAGSPCIDSGYPDLKFNDVDGTRNDMGVYGGPFGNSYEYPEPGRRCLYVVSNPNDGIINILNEIGLYVTTSTTIPSDLSPYDLVICSEYSACTPTTAPYVGSYVQNGGGAILLGGTPSTFGGGGYSCSNISEWFGTSQYSNVNVCDAILAFDNPLETSLNQNDVIDHCGGPGGAAVKNVAPDVTILANWTYYTGNIYSFLRTYQGGRVAFWAGGVSYNADSQLLFKALCQWLIGDIVVNSYKISGINTYHWYQLLPVENVTLALSGTSASTTMSDPSGYFEFINLDEGGNYQITPSKIGDFWESETITSYDASLAAQISVNFIPNPTEEEIKAADVDEDGVVLLYDASMIAMYAVGLPPNPESHVGDWIFLPTDRTYNSLNADINDADFTAIVLGDVDVSYWPAGSLLKGSENKEVYPEFKKDLSAKTGEKITLPFIACPGEEIYSIDIIVNYDPEILKYDVIRTTSISHDFQTIVNNVEQGRLRLGAYGIQPITEAGTYLEIVFEVIGKEGEECDLELESYRVNNEPEKYGIATFVVGSEKSGQPEKFVLHQNYPNPFNPGTIIQYDLANTEPEQTTIQIFNINGELVRTLVNEEKSAGHHSVIWNGRNDNGDEVVTGVYIVHLKSSHFHKSIKIAKLK